MNVFVSRFHTARAEMVVNDQQAKQKEDYEMQNPGTAFLAYPPVFAGYNADNSCQKFGSKHAIQPAPNCPDNRCRHDRSDNMSVHNCYDDKQRQQKYPAELQHRPYNSGSPFEEKCPKGWLFGKEDCLREKFAFFVASASPIHAQGRGFGALIILDTQWYKSAFQPDKAVPIYGAMHAPIIHYQLFVNI
jgi:hypothetical protein